MDRKVLFLVVEACFMVVWGEIVINTWGFSAATSKAWSLIQRGGSSLDAIEIGCTTCEELQCDHTVGYGGSPDENGETTLDAMIFDGATMDMGSVAGLRRVKNATSVARRVLENTKHSILNGDLAADFAVAMGFEETSLNTKYSKNLWKEWKANRCQPNFWKNVEPNPEETCGPYHPIGENSVYGGGMFDEKHHDTIGMIAIDKLGNIVAGVSSNGAIHKIPGRVGDASIPGAAAYADNSVGAAVTTGDGDVMMRFLPSFLIVEKMRQGKSTAEAARTTIEWIASKYPKFVGAVIAVNKNEEYAVACHGIPSFPYSVANTNNLKVVIKSTDCVH